MKVTVTAQHINDGIPEDTTNCPIAYAIKAIMPQAYVCVGDEEIQLWADIEDMNPPRTATLPPEAQEFVVAFDKDGTGQPFTFEVEL